MINPGKYDKQLTEALKACDAKQGILIVFDGKFGSSFCCQLNAELLTKIPDILRIMADRIEKDPFQGS